MIAPTYFDEITQDNSRQITIDMIKCLTVGQGSGTITIETLPNTGRYDKRRNGEHYQRSWLDPASTETLQHSVSVCCTPRGWKDPRGVFKVSQRSTRNVTGSFYGLPQRKNYAQIGVATIDILSVVRCDLRKLETLAQTAVRPHYFIAYFSRCVSQKATNYHEISHLWAGYEVAVREDSIS